MNTRFSKKSKRLFRFNLQTIFILVFSFLLFTWISHGLPYLPKALRLSTFITNKFYRLSAKDNPSLFLKLDMVKVSKLFLFLFIGIYIIHILRHLQLLYIHIYILQPKITFLFLHTCIIVLFVFIYSTLHHSEIILNLDQQDFTYINNQLNGQLTLTVDDVQPFLDTYQVNSEVVPKVIEVETKIYQFKEIKNDLIYYRS